MAIAIVLVVITVGSLIFHSWSPWWFTELASNWSDMDDTLMITFVITAIVFVIINFFVAYCVIRFRYKKERRSAYEPENKKLEWWLTVITSIGIVIMLAPGLLVYGKFVDVPDDAAVVEAVGQQWQWSYRYPGKDGVLGTVNPKEIGFSNPFGMNPDDPNGQDDILVSSGAAHLLVGKPVQILLRSKDVLHDFYVPEFRVKMDLVPGMVTSLWLTPTRVGEFEVACAEYCGVGHHTMQGWVTVDEEVDYRAWLESQPTYAELSRSKSAGEEDPSITLGREVAEAKGCLGCHSLDGSPSAGPTWKGLFGKSEVLADGSNIEVDEEYLKESIVEPNAKVVEGYSPMMPAYELSEQELRALIDLTIAIKAGNDSAANESGSSEQGRIIAESNGCLGCHSVDGSASVGPTWKGLFGKTESLEDGNQVVVDEDYLKESIVDANATIVAGYTPMMPSYSLSDEEMKALIEYTKGLSD